MSAMLQSLAVCLPGHVRLLIREQEVKLEKQKATKEYVQEFLKRQEEVCEGVRSGGDGGSGVGR